MSAHVVPLRVYFTVFGALLVLTAITLAAAYVDLGAWSAPAALSIACAKGLLVVLYFMHVRYSGKLVWLFAAAGFLWLGILFAFTLSDFVSRDRLVVYGPSYEVEQDPDSIQRRPTR